MKVWKAAIAGGVAGLVLGLLLVSDVPGGPLFGMALGAFIAADFCWATNAIRESKNLSKEIKEKEERKKRDESL